jgi:tRNA(Ile)-lysidine synthase
VPAEGPAAAEEVREAVRRSGLFARDRLVVVMISGGRDSTCLLDVAVRLLGSQAVMALHVNYGLRQAAEGDAERCRGLCAALGVELALIEVPRDARDPAEPAPGEEGGGNLQAWARELRYGEAQSLARRHDALIAAGHTASDQVETVLYRLAASPGRRALLGMAPVEGRLIRPLLAVTREQTTAYCEAVGLEFTDDASNLDERFARTRVRHGLIEALRRVHPAAEANVLRTAMLLREETELLDELVNRELDGRSNVSLARLREMPDALARLLVVRLAEQAVGGYVPQAGGRVEELLALGRRGGRAELHVGGQAGAVIEEGQLRMVRLPPRAAKPTPDED